MKYARYYLPVLLWGGLATAGNAQFNPKFGTGAPGPTVSPYLNLQRGGNPAINYYGLVRPQVAAARAFSELGNDINNLEANTQQTVQTGIRSSFMTHGRYFMNNGAGAGARTGAATTGPGQTGAPPRRN